MYFTSFTTGFLEVSLLFLRFLLRICWRFPASPKCQIVFLKKVFIHVALFHHRLVQLSTTAICAPTTKTKQECLSAGGWGWGRGMGRGWPWGLRPGGGSSFLAGPSWGAWDRFPIHHGKGIPENR